MRGRCAWRGCVVGLFGGLIVFGLGLRGELVVSELLYSPSEEEGGERGEYLQLRNNGAVAVDVTGWHFDRGIEFVFPEGSVIGAGEYLTVAKDADYLAARYFGIEAEEVVGEYSGRLSNSGERVRLRDVDGMDRIDFEYGVGGDWPAVAYGGTGHSLVFVGDEARDMEDGRAWVGSRHPKGALRERPSWWTAEMYEALESLRGVVINEVRASHSIEMDYVEFYNPTEEAIDMSGAWLSDEGSELRKHRLPAGTVLEAGEFFVVEVSGEKTGFGLSSRGETIYLAAPDGAFVVDAYGFGPQERDVGIGRYPDGGEDWYRSVEGTPGEANKRLYSPSVGISELMYHDADGQGKEYLELFVVGDQAVDVSGWEFFRGVRFEMEETLEPGRYYVIADDEQRLRESYPLPAGSLLGEYGGSLSNGGERVSLLDAWDIVVETVRYRDEWPWPPIADGLGASLVRCSWEEPYDAVGAWSGSPLGRPSPGRANFMVDCEEEGEGSMVRLSEFVYHSALRSEDDRGTEFIELTNFGREAVSLEGWSLVGDVFYEFGEGVILGSGESVVAAWSPERLAREYPQLGLEGVVEPYEGDLGNGGGKIMLVRPDKSLADGVSYDDDFPWPSLADGRATKEGGKDTSLRRVCWEELGWNAGHWVAEREPSPGRRVGEEGACASLPAVLVEAGTETRMVTSEVEPLLAAKFAKGGLVVSARVRYWVDDVEVDGGETVMSLEMKDAGEGKWSVRMPSLPANSIVRYQVEWEERGERRGVSPSGERDAFAWHAYFVEPQGLIRYSNVYHLFLSAAHWRRLEENIAVGSVIDNRLNPRWNEEAPAIFVADGIVHDVQVRHQGSSWGRNVSGGDIPFECASSRNEDQVRLLNWRIDFPSYRKHDGMDVLIYKNENGWVQYMSFRLFELAGVPAPRTGWARLRINGCYYGEQEKANLSRGHQQLERAGRDFIARWFDEVGDLFKTQPSPLFPFADGNLLTGLIHNYTEQEQYEHLYDRKTLEWKNHPFDGVADAPQAMIEGLHQARDQGQEALRDWLAEHFDVDLTLRYICAQNYVASRDGNVAHNYFLYKKAGDGKWCLLPWDMDSTMNPENVMIHPFHGADESRIGNVGNLWGKWNRIRDSFYIAYEAEYLEMLHQFNNTIYHPERLLPLVREAAVLGGFNWGWVGTLMSFIYQRHEFLNCFIAEELKCPPPLLTFRVEEGQILLEWPSDRMDYMLETAAAIAGDEVRWSQVPAPDNRYIAPPNRPSAFFRLARKQESAASPTP